MSMTISQEIIDPRLPLPRLPLPRGIMSMTISQEIIDHIEREIIPLIQRSADTALESYEVGRDSTGNMGYDPWLLGCACWNHNFNTIQNALKSSMFFSLKTSNKILEICANNNGTDFIFYLSRVDEESRIPLAGKSIKRLAQEQFFLSKEIRNTILENGVPYLAYDIDAERGLGEITLELLTLIEKGRFQANTLYTFSSTFVPLDSIYLMPESIRPPKLGKVHRDANNNTYEQAQG